jgi:hypothetical protein
MERLLQNIQQSQNSLDKEYLLLEHQRNQRTQEIQALQLTIEPKDKEDERKQQASPSWQSFHPRAVTPINGKAPTAGKVWQALVVGYLSMKL